ncbi:unnamed protein product [Triticum turgidum subsp. durum]|uniref:DUF6598 domain-containing protein n=1 Tax=Triticum turgidum subsp. durum TaxID=4567 RepID=A0A9R0Z3R6_TRITD|nr:unnamed protein product [Triticum turgidum subsp. durum]
MEPDLDMAALRKKLEDEVLGTWLWDRELDSILQEQQERDDEGDYEYYESDQEEEELHYGGSWGYGYTFYYEDGNPYYVADMEERWENQMRFPPTRSCAKRSRGIWEGSLQVEGPCQLDPTLLSAQSLLPPLPRSENRWVDKRENEPCRRAIQVFSLNLSSPHDAALEVYGMFAFRDVRNNQLRNYVFEYSRDKPCKLKPGSCKLQPLLYPHQGIYAVGLVLIEYRLLIKDEEGEDDKVLIDGYSVYAPSFYAEYERLHWHINTGHHGSIDLRMASIPKAVLAVLEFEVHHLGDNLFDSLTITAVYRTMQGGAFSVFNGKLSVCRLPSVTVCVDYTKNLTIDLYTYNSHSGDDNCYPDGVVGDSKIPGYFHYDIDDIMSDTVWFKPQKSGSSTKHSSNLYGLVMSVKVTWSSLCEPCQ